MTREDTKILLATISAFFPNFKVENETFTVNAWFSMFEEYGADIISKALKTYVSEGHEFAPNPGTLIQKAFDLMHADEYMSEGEAKGLLIKAIHDGINRSEKYFNEMPPLLQKAVGSPNIISNLAIGRESEVEDACNRILYSYHAYVERDKKDRTTPKDVKLFIEQAKGNVAIEDKGGKDV